MITSHATLDIDFLTFKQPSRDFILFLFLYFYVWPQESTSDGSDVIVLEEDFNHGILNPNEGMDEETSIKYFAALPKGQDRNLLDSYPQLDSSHSSQSSRFCISQKFEDIDNNNKVKESCNSEIPLKIYDSSPPFKVNINYGFHKSFHIFAFNYLTFII